MHSFTDTNVIVSYVFLLEPFNNKSNYIFNDYDIIYYSKLVKNEVEKIFKEKQIFLTEFFQKLGNNLGKCDLYEITESELIKFAKNLFSSIKHDEIDNIIISFWSRYIIESLPTVDSVKKNISICINDVKFKSYSRIIEWNLKSKLTGTRVEKYNHIHNKLRTYNVHFPDDEIILDAHDHNLKNNFDLDFITFDDGFYMGICKIEDFSFNNIKSRGDYW